MKDKQKINLYERQDHIIVPHMIFGDLRYCTYCGDEATCEDHIIPVSYLIRECRARTSSDAKRGIRTFCCDYCNQKILKAKLFPSFSDRVWYVQKHLRSIIKNCYWTNNDINEMNGRLRDYIIHKQSLNEFFRMKEDWLDSQEFLKVMKDLKRYDYFDKSSPKYREWMCDYFQQYL